MPHYGYILTQDVPHIVECIFSPSPLSLHTGATCPRSICCTKIQKFWMSMSIAGDTPVAGRVILDEGYENFAF